MWLVAAYLNNARTASAVQDPTPVNPAWGTRFSDRLGYDGAGRTIAKRYLPDPLNQNNGYDDSLAFVGFTTAYDSASNKKFERQLHAETRSHLYAVLDSLNRLREYQRGTLASGGRSSRWASPAAAAAGSGEEAARQRWIRQRPRPSCGGSSTRT